LRDIAERKPSRSFLRCEISIMVRDSLKALSLLAEKDNSG